MMIDTQKAGVPVVAVANPGSGPGTEGDRPSYEKGMKALRDCGIEVRFVRCGASREGGGSGREGERGRGGGGGGERQRDKEGRERDRPDDDWNVFFFFL